MRRIRAIAAHDLRLLLVERGSFVARLLMPIAFILVVGIADDAVQSEAPAARVLELVDRDGSDLSASYLRSVTDQLPERVAGVVVCGAGADECEATTDYTVVVPEGFARSLEAGGDAAVRLVLALGDPQEASRLEPMLAAAARRVELALDAGEAARVLAREPFGEQAAGIAVSRARELLGEERVNVIRETIDLPERYALVGFRQSVPGMGSMFVMLSILSGAAILVEERRRGTLARTLVAPISRVGYVVGKTTGRFIVGMMQYLVAIATGLVIGAVFGIEFGSSPLLMVAVMVSFVLAMSSVSILLATLVTREQQASGLTTLLAVTLAPLGGAWWSLDIEIVPDIMRSVAVVSPFYWVMEGFRAAIHDLGFGPAALPIGVLLAIALAAGAAAGLRMRRD